jgi:hypothetical protein
MRDCPPLEHLFPDSPEFDELLRKAAARQAIPASEQEIKEAFVRFILMYED